jgi:hypothetical protein
VGSSNRVVWIVWSSSSSDFVTPPSSNSGTSWDVDDVVILVVDSSVACKFVVVDVLDWVVGSWGANTSELTLVLSVDGDFLI